MTKTNNKLSIKTGFAKKNVYVLISVFLLIALIFEFTIQTVYGEWFITNWGTASGETVLPSIDLLPYEDMAVDKTKIQILSNNTDAKFYLNIPTDTNYLEITVYHLNSVRPVYFKLYYMNDGNYSETYTETSRIHEGNNAICLDHAITGTLRVDIEGTSNYSLIIPRMVVDTDIQISWEFIGLFLCVILLSVLIFAIFKNRLSIAKYIADHKTGVIVVCGLFFWFLLWSIILPFNSGPDEEMRFDVADFIYRYKKLPHGNDPLLCQNNAWGISYAYSPFLSYLLSGILMYISSLFGITGMGLFHVARLVSVFSSTFTVFFLIKISQELKLKHTYALPILVGMWPEFTFISAYVNNDALAIMSTSVIIYAWCLGMKSKWDKKSCIYLIIGMSLCVSSYYNCYGYILISLLLFVCHHIYMHKKENKTKAFPEMLKKGLLIFIFTCILSGWWFIRNYIIYNGDIMGNKVSRETAIQFASASLNPLNKHSLKEEGVSLFHMLFKMDWIKISAKSFIASFGYMEIWLSPVLYTIAICIAIAGLILMIIHLIKAKHSPMDKALYVCFAFSSVIVVSLSIFYSYTSDFQAQGRYILPMLIPVQYFIYTGFANCKRLPKNTISLLEALLMLLNIYCLTCKIIPWYYW